MILGGIAILEAFSNWWQVYCNGVKMTKDERFDAIGPNSFDVTLASAIMLQHPTKKGYLGIDPYDPVQEYYKAESMSQYLLQPRDFILGVTQERFVTEEPLTIHTGSQHSSKICFVQKYDGRSTMGRLGIASHVTAGFGDYGFKDYWTLEIVNLGQVPVVLHAGMRIGQISFEAVYQPKLYEGSYTDVSKMPKPKAPKLGREKF